MFFQAIMAAYKELDEMKLPVEQKSQKEKSKHVVVDSTVESLPNSAVKSPAMPTNSMKMSPQSDTHRLGENHQTNYRHTINEGCLNVVRSGQNDGGKKDPYEFVDVVDEETKINSKTANSGQKVPVSSPEIVVDSPANSPPRSSTNATHPQPAFHSQMPTLPAAKPMPQYPANVRFNIRQPGPVPPGAGYLPGGPLPPQFHHQLVAPNQQQLPGTVNRPQVRGMCSPVSSASNISAAPTNLPHSSTHSPFQQPAASHLQLNHQKLPPASSSAFQATKQGAFNPAMPPVQLVPAYPAHSGFPPQNQRHDSKLPANLPGQPGSLNVPSAHGSIQHRETSTSSGIYPHHLECYIFTVKISQIFVNTFQALSFLGRNFTKQ